MRKERIPWYQKSDYYTSEVSNDGVCVRALQYVHLFISNYFAKQ